jgi:ABC-2 type transport system ATP-binding protein
MAGISRVLDLDPLTDRRELHERVGVQLQESALPPKIRVGEAVELYASFYRRPADGGRLLEVLGLEAKRRSYFRDLSGGQKQRLSIVLALIGQPEIAILDELTTGLDPEARRETWGLIEGVRDRGVTIVLVTHFMEEAERLCDRVALIDRGRVIALGPPARLGELAATSRRVRLRASDQLADAVLEALPEVSAVEHHGSDLVVVGSGNLVTAVVLAFDRAGLGGVSFFTAYVPTLLVLVLLVLGLLSLPIQMAGYREQGVLRRMSTTPVPASALLGAQLAVNLILAVVSIAMLLGVGAGAFSLVLPAQAGWYLLSLVLTVAAMLAIGLWVAALATTGQVANAMGLGLFYPLGFFSGLYFPLVAIHSGVINQIATVLPTGAAVDALRASLAGHFPGGEALGVLAAYAIVFSATAVRWFRWGVERSRTRRS